MDLQHLGWGDDFARHFATHRECGLRPGRVAVQHRDHYRLLAADGERDGAVTGRFRHEAASPADFPAIGDWVAFEQPDAPGPPGGVLIHAVLPRRSRFSRRAAGTVPYEQVLAANVDYLFLMTGLDGNYSVRRIERYVTQAWESGAVPVVLLNKSDLCADPESAVDEVRQAVIGVDVHAVCAGDGEGCQALSPYLRAGRTIAVVGSSGVGKSTLVNRLLGGERMRVTAVRAGDSRGRHTTSRRELLSIDGGALLIDTPGMREFGLWGDDEDGGAGESFDDLEALARQCRFADCGHGAEPGCAVRAAVEAGALDPGRLANWLGMAREVARQRQRERERDGRRMRDDAETKRVGRRSDRRTERRRLRAR